MMALLLALSLIDLQISQLVSLAPATIDARVRILPRPDNREACVTLYTEGERIDMSCWSLNGENEATFFPVRWKRLAAGDYLAVLSVRTTSGIVDKSQGFQVHE